MPAQIYSTLETSLCDLNSIPCALLFAAFDKNEIRFILNELIQDSKYAEESLISLNQAFILLFLNKI
jgi:hypothetical protein